MGTTPAQLGVAGRRRGVRAFWWSRSIMRLGSRSIPRPARSQPHPCPSSASSRPKGRCARRRCRMASRSRGRSPRGPSYGVVDGDGAIVHERVLDLPGTVRDAATMTTATGPWIALTLVAPNGLDPSTVVALDPYGDAAHPYPHPRRPCRRRPSHRSSLRCRWLASGRRHRGRPGRMGADGGSARPEPGPRLLGWPAQGPDPAPVNHLLS